MDYTDMEYEIITMLAEKRWKLQQQIDQVDAAIAKNSHNFVVGADGLVEVGLGVCCWTTLNQSGSTVRKHF